MRIALGQFNAVVGDLSGNAQKMRHMYAEALKCEVDLIVFPELAFCGYPPEDLLLKDHFLEDSRAAMEKFAADCPNKTIVAGFPEDYHGDCYNSAAILQNGRVTKVYRKSLLPNYGVFDESRYFEPGHDPVVLDLDGFRVAITICRDVWDIRWLEDFLGTEDKVQMILNISASPFHMGKTVQRQQIISQAARKFDCVVAYCNLVGGQDEIVFDGRSVITDATGQVVTQAKAFDEDLLIVDLAGGAGEPVQVKPLKPPATQPADLVDEVYQALVLGTRDYARKNGFSKVLLGISGGIDSSVVASIAAAALGAKNVTGITMPSKFNSPQTIADARKLAENLGIEFMTVPIETVLERFDSSLQQVPGWDREGVAYENLQARIRGTILMSLSNQFGALVLTSGNKSETAVGYTTLYGDTAGGFAVIKDVPKTLVYKLAARINKINQSPVIPLDVINRPPTAELRDDQKDSDTLPDYDLLDRILKGYVEEDKSAQQLIADSLPADVVGRVIAMVDRNEYKRRQSPPGIKITPKAFGKDRRLPITNRYSSCADTMQ